jgi:hypothetical protein
VTPPKVSTLDREWKRTRYMVARGRSRWRKWWRRTQARFTSSPTPDARMRDADRKDPD